MLKATIDRFEGDVAILSLETGEKLNWPKNKMPKNIKEGSVVWLSILELDEEATKKQRELAKEILNEILKNEQ